MKNLDSLLKDLKRHEELISEPNTEFDFKDLKKLIMRIQSEASLYGTNPKKALTMLRKRYGEKIETPEEAIQWMSRKLQEDAIELELGLDTACGSVSHSLLATLKQITGAF
jgi:hypothetical protein